MAQTQRERNKSVHRTPAFLTCVKKVFVFTFTTYTTFTFALFIGAGGGECRGERSVGRNAFRQKSKLGVQPYRTLGVRLGFPFSRRPLVHRKAQAQTEGARVSKNTPRCVAQRHT